jgi:hypothetical protein
VGWKSAKNHRSSVVFGDHINLNSLALHTTHHHSWLALGDYLSLRRKKFLHHRSYPSLEVRQAGSFFIGHAAMLARFFLNPKTWRLRARSRVSVVLLTNRRETGLRRRSLHLLDPTTGS